MVKKRDTPQHSSDLTFAHEVGHNFGSDHDTEDTCPGQFVMYPYSHQPPYTSDNRQFSDCSVRSINDVLNRMASGKKTNCLTRGRIGRLVDLDGAGGAGSAGNVTFDDGGASSAKSGNIVADAVVSALIVAIGLIAAA